MLAKAYDSNHLETRVVEGAISAYQPDDRSYKTKLELKDRKVQGFLATETVLTLFVTDPLLDLSVEENNQGTED